MITLEMLIKECRSVAAAARKLDVSQQSINRWRSGKFRPSRHLIKLAKRKGVNLEWSTIDPDLSKATSEQPLPACEPSEPPTPSV